MHYILSYFLLCTTVFNINILNNFLAEIFEPMREELCSSNNNMSQIPLVRLVKQLLRCISF